MIDFRTMTPAQAIKRAYSDLMAAGASGDQAKSLVALSISESAGLWVVARRPPMWYDADCWPTSLLVGLELFEDMWKRDAADNVVRDSKGKPIVDAWLLQPSIKRNPETLKFLIGEGFVREMDASRNKHVQRVAEQSPPYYYATGGFTRPGDPSIAYFFEWAMNREFGHLLDNFSIGPTMRYLAYTQMAVDDKAPASNGQVIRYYPKTWDELFSKYMARSVGEQLVDFDYIKPAPGVVWPAARPLDDTNADLWLRNQVGGGMDARTIAKRADYVHRLFLPNLQYVLKTV